MELSISYKTVNIMLSKNIKIETVKLLKKLTFREVSNSI